ncbi:hypothetical protein RBB79_12770 [Tunturiibacter empetritectus]|uniref:Uncharacterized protein n=1 Tax=Tunturiibacter lichenicola TaxID=2051959 RepID=A0A852VHD4_9BACT|nr:hypothetical protein [Edaphobacter lichenicola]NYF90469.1 hypothetical protein [Edaphobacter lichenicola]
MPGIPSKLRFFRVLIAFAMGLIGLIPAPIAARAQGSHPGPVTGVIDGVAFEGDQYYVHGWACQEGQRGSISVNLYASHPAGATPAGTYVMAGSADLVNEPAVDQECHDASGCKHRFRIALPNQQLRTFQGKKLFVHGIALAGNVENALLAGSGRDSFPAPRWPPDPPTPSFLDGPRVAAFDTAKESCEQIDIPDAAARAFRDYKGTVHLIASHYVTRAGLGPTLETAKHNCQVVYKSPHDGNIANFDDATWLNAFYSVDGKRIVALGHTEYHGWEHPGMCATKNDSPSCWYNVDTFNLSTDGGYHFARPNPPGNYFISLPYKYQPNQGPEGYSVDSNIVKVGQWYYDEVYAWGWPPNCGGGKGQKPCLVPDGACAIRTANILDPSSWRGWDGKDFTVQFVDPYRGTVANPKAHVCAPVPYLDYATGINYYPASHLFVATLWNQGSASSWGPEGVYFTTSPDFIHWSKPKLAMTQNQMLKSEPEGNWSYMYFSLIDPKSTDSNYMTITDNPYLYYVRMDGNHPPYQRVLFRQRIKLNWLAQGQK